MWIRQIAVIKYIAKKDLGNANFSDKTRTRCILFLFHKSETVTSLIIHFYIRNRRVCLMLDDHICLHILELT